MKIQSFKCFGWGGETGQVQRIRAGFLELGLIELDNNPDFIYSNDEGSHAAAIECKKRNPGAKLILNILDIPEFLLPNGYSLENCKKLLSHADAVTSISNYVKGQLVKYFNTNSSVIYQPKMNTFKTEGLEKKYKYLFVGRVNYPNKRNNLAVEALQLLGANESEVLGIGPEYIGFGDYLGVVSEADLSKVFSSVDFVFCTGKIEGLSLVPIETISCGYAVPIVCFDMTTVRELFSKPEAFIVEPKAQNIANFINLFKSDQEIRRYASNLNEEYKDMINNHFVGTAVAKKILEVANGI
jgi:hypothetical protein